MVFLTIINYKSYCITKMNFQFDAQQLFSFITYTLEQIHKCSLQD